MDITLSVSAITPTLQNYQNYNGSIAVIALKMPDGKGDVAMGYEIYKIVQRTLGAASLTFSYFDAHFPQYSGATVVITPQEALDWEITNIRIVYERIKNREIDIIFITSAFADNLIPAQIRNGGIPLVKIRECGAGKADPRLTSGPVYTMGIAQGEIGILFPERLFRRYISPQQNDRLTGWLQTYVHPSKVLANLILEYASFVSDAPTKNNSLTRLQKLSVLPKEILNCLLGSDPQTDTQKKLEVFNGHSRLYSAYGRANELNNLVGFINALCASFSPSDHANIVIYIFNDYPDLPLQTENTPIFFMDAIDKTTLKSQRFTSIHIYKRSEGVLVKETISLVAKPKKEKNQKTKERKTRDLILIFLPVKPEHVDAIAMASERESYSGGESTFFKYLALGSYASHEVSIHKLRFIFDLIKLLEKSNPNLALLLINCYFGSQAIYKYALEHLMKDSYRVVDTAKISTGMMVFFKALRAPEDEKDAKKPRPQQKGPKEFEIYRSVWNDFTASLYDCRFEIFVPVILQHLPPPKQPKQQTATVELLP